MRSIIWIFFKGISDPEIGSVDQSMVIITLSLWVQSPMIPLFMIWFYFMIPVGPFWIQNILCICSFIKNIQ